MKKWLNILEIINQYSGPLPLKPHPFFKRLYINRLMAENLLALLLQYIGIMTFAPAFFPPMWFASGTACAFLFMRSYSILPGIWLGTFLVFYLGKMELISSIYCATLFTAQGFFLLWSGYHFIGPVLLFYQIKKFFNFIFYTAICTALTSFFMVNIYNSIGHLINPWLIGLQWWLANFLGTIIVSLGIATLDGYFAEWGLFKKMGLVSLSPFLALLLFGIFLICSTKLLMVLGSSLMVFLIILMISIFYGWCGTVLSLFLWAIIYNFAASFAAPLFISNSAQVLIGLQLFWLFTTIFSLVIGIKNTYFH